MSDSTLTVPGHVSRYWGPGVDGQLHAVLSLDGDAQSYCNTALAAASTPARAQHEECLALELHRVAHSTRRR